MNFLNKAKLGALGLLMSANVFGQDADTTATQESNLEEMARTEAKYDKFDDEKNSAFVDSVSNALCTHTIDANKVAFVKINSYYDADTKKNSDTAQVHDAFFMPMELGSTYAEILANIDPKLMARNGLRSKFELLDSKRNNLNNVATYQKDAQNIFFPTKADSSFQYDFNIMDAVPGKLNGETGYLVYIALSNVPGVARQHYPVNDPLDTLFSAAGQNIDYLESGTAKAEFVYFRPDEAEKSDAKKSFNVGLYLGLEGIYNVATDKNGLSGIGLRGGYNFGRLGLGALLQYEPTQEQTTTVTELENTNFPPNGNYVLENKTIVNSRTNFNFGPELKLNLTPNVYVFGNALWTAKKNHIHSENMETTTFNGAVVEREISDDNSYTSSNIKYNKFSLGLGVHLNKNWSVNASFSKYANNKKSVNFGFTYHVNKKQ